ncbi:hypothetical protein [Demequina salsinemoris]|uniref:hypothetical protein n=1 Tax=Demequina salsinemoris TaxID=577470 RepID=UPI000782049A|nr:hypothetical protein [Demequina salsinemoris]
MSHAVLHEQYVAIQPRTSSRVDPFAPLGTTTHGTALEPLAPPTTGGPVSWLRHVVSGVSLGVLTLGVLAALTVAALSVGMLVVAQRLLHLD